MARVYGRIYYLAFVQVLFNFPNGLAFEVQMDAVPRRGETVNLLRVTEVVFRDAEDWKKYNEYDYPAFIWEVERVSWTPAAASYSYVNIILKRKD